jgi:hypothetical protein
MLTAAIGAAQTGYFGTSKVTINPSTPIMLSGYASRSHLPEATGVQQAIVAQAAAFGSGAETAILFTVDCTGVPDNVVDPLKAQLNTTLGLAPERIVVSSTHSHSCPHVTGYLTNLFDPPLSSGENQRINQYTQALSQKLEAAAVEAMNNRTPGHQISWGNGTVDFAANRRGSSQVDHDLPVMVVRDALGEPAAIITSYAAHAVTLNPGDNLVSGDWPGYARERIEAMFPGAAAMVMIGAGADANPNAFGLAAAQNHGQSIADEIERLITSDLLTPVSQDLDAFHSEIELDYATALLPGDPPSARLASAPGSALYGVTSWTFGRDLAMVFMEGEVVVDYSLRLKSELGDSVWVNGYSDDVQGYIPSERILYEGGYEADSSGHYYALPGRFAHGLENKIVEEIHDHLEEFSDDSHLLRLLVDWSSGAATIANIGSEPIAMQAYTLASPTGQLKPGAGSWNSFEAQGIAGWDRADNSDSSRLTEFNTAGVTSFAPGMSVSLGTPVTVAPPAGFGDPFSVSDVSFEYQAPSGEVIRGVVTGLTGDGAHNNLVLTIDPETGAAAIQNESPFFDASITAYTIASEEGALLAGNGQWTSLEDQGLAGWDEADNSNSFRLSEFKTTGATLLPGGETILSLGDLLDVSGGQPDVENLRFEFLLSSGIVLEGVIELGDLPTVGNGADFDADGDVDGADFLTWQRTIGASVPSSGDPDGDGTITAADLAVWKSRFGSSAASPLGTAAPEASFAAMYLAAACGALGFRRKLRVRAAAR